METPFEIVSESLRNPDKHKNGDFLQYEILPNGLVVLTLSDGIGTRNCDWLASQTACSEFISLCRLHQDQEITPKVAKGFCDKIDTTLAQITGSCKGLLCCFCAVVWHPGQNKCLIIHLGDVRIYKFSLGSVFTLTEDDNVEVLMRDTSGKLFTSHGSAISASGVSNALGNGYSMAHAAYADFNEGEALMLVSDGFYKCSHTFENDMQWVLETLDLKLQFGKIIQRYKEVQKDDASVLMLRRNDVAPALKAIYKDYTDYEATKNLIPRALIAGFLLKDLKNALTQKNTAACIEIVNLMKRDDLLPPTKQLDHLLAQCRLTGFLEPAVFNGIIDLIRIQNLKR